MKGTIDTIFNPASIAIVGATTRANSVGQAVIRNLIHGEYQGVLYPVHPRLKSLYGVKAYPALSAIPDAIDLVVIIVKPEMVPDLLEEAAQKGVSAAVVISAGFKEIGGKGAALEKRIQAIAANHHIRLVGPNCLGVINTDAGVRMNASFARIMPRPGNIGFISQSGALCTSVLDYAEGRKIGFSKFISFGNKADVNEIDLLHYLGDDPRTKVICMYLEDLSAGQEFIRVASKISWDKGKPILAVKSGTSSEGARAAASHTGSLVGTDSAYDAIFLQSGIQRVEGVNELFHYAMAFSRQPLPKGRRIAIVTNAGGPGIMATDAAIRSGLKLAPFSSDTEEQLKTHLPPTANIHNPVDVIGDATHERYEIALKTVMQDENVDGAIVLLTPQAMTDILETAQIVPNVAKTVDKPILCSFMGIVDVSEGVAHLEESGIPNYVFPEAASRTMAAMARFGERLSMGNRILPKLTFDRDRANTLIQTKLNGNLKCYLPEREAAELLGCYDLPLLSSRLVTGPADIEAAIDGIRFPVAMKIVSRDIVHKVDAGGVRLNITDVDQARHAFAEIVANGRRFNPEARIDGVLMQEMAGKGVEVIIGCARDPKFGPIVMFGLGGTLVEALKDVTFRLAPMCIASAHNMIRSIKTFTVLQGVRGNPPSDLAAIKDCILRVSTLVANHPEISELDINPLIVYPDGQGAVVADCRILLKSDNA
ncbi:acetate--CoA ligase family protein [Desulfosarcina ovata]|uniref:Acyl-CoA synthetase n=1 Tax=Desulfosarcina ovata subsp. ovata TaxID=2752305 RepID=A0A5K8ACI1_9BACT|nr:acetate--CoA ligase [Desulfosarcina ovata]BBO90209.1 acyl-CoA synthetase [Desulfosarcina ovata subsp. ovata]